MQCTPVGDLLRGGNAYWADPSWGPTPFNSAGGLAYRNQETTKTQHHTVQMTAESQLCQFKNRDAATCTKHMSATPPDCPTAQAAVSGPFDVQIGSKKFARSANQSECS